MLQDVNVVSAPVVAKERGIVVEETTREMAGDYESLITVTVVTQTQTRSGVGTVFADGRPRIVNIKASHGRRVRRLNDLHQQSRQAGFIGRFSSTLGEAGINIATFHADARRRGGSAVALIEIDGELPGRLLAKVRALPAGWQSARPSTSKSPRIFRHAHGSLIGARKEYLCVMTRLLQKALEAVRLFAAEIRINRGAMLALAATSRHWRY